MDLAKKARIENEKWENSLEGIHYNLNFNGDVYSDSEDYRIMISETLQKIPKDIRDNVLFECIFIIDENLGLTINIQVNPKGQQPLILLNRFALEKESRSFKMNVIAHEIAHFALNHHNIHPKNLHEHLVQEKKADDLIEQWGFSRTNEKLYKNKIKY